MPRIQSKLIVLTLISLWIRQNDGYSSQPRQGRSVASRSGPRGVDAPLKSSEIDLETLNGVEQVTRLVLLKTDSLPDDSEEGIDGRYLNNLMETLYTGLRKPFKSVSADILGIFPSFEEIQVRCQRSKATDPEGFMSNRSRSEISDSGQQLYKNVNDTTTESTLSDSDEASSYKSSVQVCQAVTGDCLSIDDLVQILPPSVTTFKQALVGLCPVVLFRIINQLCHRTGKTYGDQTEMMTANQVAGQIQEGIETFAKESKKDHLNLDNLIRETKMLKNLQSSDNLGSKKPQKLHKKLKTQTTSKNNAPLSSGSLRQHGVDEQLLKIRLKLTEPSIEKVWIFSLLFVVLSIVVSMGGLIVLPFVRKTTRRRILTLFEGLAVGGLAGSATLHMFPQAFGLVDENYHKYFWRIFVVFLGIYLCYLCERIMKIVKVVRAKMRRSCASLADIGMVCYGFPSVSREISATRTNLGTSFDSKYNKSVDSAELTNAAHRWGRMKKKGDPGLDPNCEECMELERDMKLRQRKQLIRTGGRRKSVSRSGLRFDNQVNECMVPLEEASDECSECLGMNLKQQPNDVTRQRLVHCLKSVQKQFSPVYAVQNQNLENISPPRSKQKGSNSKKIPPDESSKEQSTSGRQERRVKRNRLNDFNSSFDLPRSNRDKTDMKRQIKQREVETMLYHQNRIHQSGVDGCERDRNYLQRRLINVKDVAGERQDQDNAAKMSVDTVAWMIVFGDAVLNVIDGLSIGAAFERNILAGISISVAVMLEEVIHRLGTFAVLIRAGMSMQQSLLCIFLSACALFPGLIIGILLSDATEDATPYIFCAAGGIFLYMALVDVMKEMNRSIENAMRKDIKSTLQIFALQNVGIILAVVFLSFLALYEQAMDFEEYQMQYNQPS